MSRQSGRIVRELHDEPHIEGRRITVRFVHDAVEQRGLSPRDAADQYDLDLADVCDALAYYHRHPDEMETVEERHEELAD